MAAKVERRLAAILAADVVGYSRLMSEDEVGTLARLKAHRAELIDPLVAEHGGRVVKLMGDGALVEFASVTDAVSCAVRLQRGMAERNTAVDAPADRRIEFRVGINLGDVIVEGDGDLYGDGVNLAARLEGLAPPGGICVSEAVHAQVAGRTDAAFEPAGEHRLKNIARPVKVWRWSAAAPPPGCTDMGADEEDRPALPDKPSLAVLPFSNFTAADPEGEFLADGFTEDLITAVSRIGGLFVIARNSSFAYKSRHVDAKQIAAELGVRYLVEGSLRRLGGRFRVNAQLIDAHSGHHLWAEVFDVPAEGFYEAQDEVVRGIVASTQTRIMLHEGEAVPRRPREDQGTEEILKRAWSLLYQLTPDSLREAADLAEAVVRRSPGSARAHQILAGALFHATYLGHVDDRRRGATVERARRAAERAVELFEPDEYSHWVLGLVMMLERDHEGAVAELTRAIEINPNCSLAYGSLGTALAWGGRAEEAISNTEVALRANPRDPSNFFRFLVLALAHFTAGRYDEAASWAARSLQRKKGFKIPHLLRVAALALAGDAERARSALDDMAQHFPAVTRAYVEALPFVRAADREAFVRGLKIAGVLD